MYDFLTVKRIIIVVLILYVVVVIDLTSRQYQKNYQICELNDISDIDTSKLFKYYKIDSIDLYARKLKLDTVTVYDDSGKSYLQVSIACPITSRKHTEITSFYTSEDMWMMYQNEDYSYVEDFGPTYAWFGFTFESEVISDSVLNSDSKVKANIMQEAIAAYSSMVVSDSNKYFTREKDAYLSEVYNEIINDTLDSSPIVLKFTYNPYEQPPSLFNVFSYFKFFY